MVQFFNGFARGGVVGNEAHVILRSVHFLHIDAATIGAPADAAVIALGGIAGVQINDAVGPQVIHADAHQVDGLPCHRIFGGVHRGLPSGNFGGGGHRYERIVGYLALV